MKMISRSYDCWLLRDQDEEDDKKMYLGQGKTKKMIEISAKIRGKKIIAQRI
jgi:hypothetical protein